MNQPGRHGKCPEDPCIGPRCKAHTGKTARKNNWARPKPNKHEGTRIIAGSDKKRK